MEIENDKQTNKLKGQDYLNYLRAEFEKNKKWRTYVGTIRLMDILKERNESLQEFIKYVKANYDYDMIDSAIEVIKQIADNPHNMDIDVKYVMFISKALDVPYDELVEYQIKNDKIHSDVDPKFFIRSQIPLL